MLSISFEWFPVSTATSGGVGSIKSKTVESFLIEKLNYLEAGMATAEEDVERASTVK